VAFDARKSRRLRLKRRAAAMTGFGPAEIVDLSPNSLALLHDWSAEKGAETWLEFSWAGRLIRLDCEVRTCRRSPADAKYRSGVLVRGGFSADEFRQRVEAEIAKGAPR
jgi:hypothetical protein